jgi:hypothetical protein
MDAPDFGHLEPMLDVTLAHLRRHGITEQPDAVVGDAGYWHTRQIESIAERGIEVLVPPDGAARDGKRPGWENGVYERMREKLQTGRGRTLYAIRKITIEPVFGQIKYNRRVDQFMRRGSAAVHSELRLVASNTQHAQAPQPLDRQHRLRVGDSPSSRGDTFTAAARAESRSFRIFRRSGGQALVRHRRRGRFLVAKGLAVALVEAPRKRSQNAPGFGQDAESLGRSDHVRFGVSG